MSIYRGKANQPEPFFLALDAALRASVSATEIALSEPRWGRCDYQGRRHNWERDDLPATWLLKPAKFRGQREIRVRWETTLVPPLKFIILKAPAIIPYCDLLLGLDPTVTTVAFGSPAII